MLDGWVLWGPQPSRERSSEYVHRPLGRECIRYRALAPRYMPNKRASNGVPWEPDMDTAIRLTWVAAGLFMLLAIVSAIGGSLGWWDLIGEIGMGIGGTVSIVLALIAVLSSAGRGQVMGLGQDVRSVDENVRSLDANVRSVDANVRSVDQNVEMNGEKLDLIGKALAGEGGVLRELDRIELELDAQTGVLNQQLTVLETVRDRL